MFSILKNTTLPKSIKVMIIANCVITFGYIGLATYVIKNQQKKINQLIRHANLAVTVIQDLIPHCPEYIVEEVIEKYQFDVLTLQFDT